MQLNDLPSSFMHQMANSAIQNKDNGGEEGDTVIVRLLILHGKFTVAICNVRRKYSTFHNERISVSGRW